jgi:hypothetical protein
MKTKTVSDSRDDLSQEMFWPDPRTLASPPPELNPVNPRKPEGLLFAWESGRFASIGYPHWGINE